MQVQSLQGFVKTFYKHFYSSQVLSADKLVATHSTQHTAHSTQNSTLRSKLSGLRVMQRLATA
jgi:hypothetical protein